MKKDGFVGFRTTPVEDAAISRIMAHIKSDGVTTCRSKAVRYALLFCDKRIARERKRLDMLEKLKNNTLLINC